MKGTEKVCTARFVQHIIILYFYQNFKDISKGHYHLNPFLFDASVRFGVGSFTAFANYNLNGLFESGKGPEYFPFSAGLSLNF